MIIAHVLLSFNPPYIIPWRHFISVQIMNNSLNKARIRSIVIIIGNRALLVYKIVDFLPSYYFPLKKKKKTILISLFEYSDGIKCRVKDSTGGRTTKKMAHAGSVHWPITAYHIVIWGGTLLYSYLLFTKHCEI